MPATFVIFGASGDLTRRKLVPALYQLFRKRRFGEPVCVLGFSRTPMSDEVWREKLAAAARDFVGADFRPDVWNAFAASLHYHVGDVQRPNDFAVLAQRLQTLEPSQPPSARIYYLATAPEFFEPIIRGLGAQGLAAEFDAPRRLVLEKPIGTSLETARRLNETAHGVFRERQIFRIDHYLGKETVQNLLVLRFANAVFEPIWNRNYIDHVQITATEETDAAQRGAYYDATGVLRDMFQNHLMQLLCFTAMEPPSRFDAVAVRNEKVKILEAVRPVARDDVARHTFRGQYVGYRQHEHVAPNSQTATFAAIRLHLDNWRWQGVPFYLRSGKAMSCRSTQIVIQFREPPHQLFNTVRPIQANRLLIQIQPAEGIQLHLQSKVPDAGMELMEMDLAFQFCQLARPLPEAYERLLLDVLSGDASLFARNDEVELSWRIIDPILAAWETTDLPKLEFYERGQWGPPACDDWMKRDGRTWMNVCPVLHEHGTPPQWVPIAN